MSEYIFKTVYFPKEKVRKGSSARITISIPTNQGSKPEFLAFVNNLSSREFRLAIGDPFVEDLESQAHNESRSFSNTCYRMLEDYFSKHISPATANSHQQLELSLKTLSSSEPLADLGVTFRDSLRQRVFGWYPYVEGFSATYTMDAILRYKPRTVYDPFGGSGTTQLAASCLGIPSFYSEINPFMCFVAETKVGATQWARANFTQFTDACVKYSHFLKSKSFERLASTIDLSGYYAAFPDRDFFEEGHIRELLAATNYARTFESVSPHLRDILLLACSANAVRSSNMTRRADLRRRRPDEYKERIVDVTQFIVDTLQRFREDVAQLPVKMALMNRASDDARDLPPQFNNSFDFVLTSPPYLNGTNYFRNTKIELWLLNFIETENELANFRKRAICAGINNVSRSNITKHSFDRVEEVVAQLNATEGDSRIALLVRQYFSDMCETFSAVLRSLTPGGVFLLDIGDSKFYGVHVPTDHLLVDAACYAGLKLKHRHVLARRHSRDKTELTQVELVFEKPLRNTTISAHVRCSVDNLEKRISEFQEELPYKTPPYDKRNWGHTLHSLCCYQGKLKPSMAYWLVKYFVPKHGRVLDPLGGVGTISFEAALQGHESVSNDKSPFASIVARAKLSPPSLDEARETLQALWSEIESVPDSDIDYTSVGFGLNGTVRDFYHPDTLIEILKARKLFLSRPPRSNNEAFIWACLLHVLHGNRPYALSRTSHPITPFHPKGPAIYKSVRDKIFQRASNALDTKLPATFLPGKGINGDFRNLDPKELGYFDAIITSPPFMGMRFDRPNWLRLWFCGWGEHDFHKTSLDFLERQQTKSTDCYKDFFATTRRLISDAGILILHMGSGKDDKLLEDLRRLSNDQFVFRGEVRENVLSVAQHGIRDKGMTTQHHLMFLTPR